MKTQLMKKALSVAVAAVLMTQTMFVGGVAAAEQSDPWIATPYHREDGTLVDGLEQAVHGKKHWLETTDPLPVTVKVEDGVLTMQNGIIQRDFKIPSVGGTEFYTKNYENLYIEKTLLKDEVKPDAYIALYDVPYREVYKDEGIKLHHDSISSADCTVTIPEDCIMKDPEYFFVGGKGLADTFVFDGYEIQETCEKPFDWSPNPIYGDPDAAEWPPKGQHVEFNFSAPDTFPEAYRGVQVKVIYEMYDNISAMKKRVEITNTADNQIMVGRLAPEVLNGNENLDELLTLENSYTCGDQSTLPVNRALPCRCNLEKASSPFKELENMAHTCYEVGPAYELETGESLNSFDTYEIIHSTYWFELQMRERLGIYHKLYPWTSDNPLTHHNTGSLTKAVIDQAATAGFEMIIQSYSAPDRSGQMLTRDQSRLDEYKALVDYAHSKKIAIGIYQAQYQQGSYKGGESYGTNGDGHWGTWCMASAAFDDYWDNFKNFVKYTGLDCVEIDGAWPGEYCVSGEKHVNEDRQTDPADPSDTTTGNPSKYKVHNGFFDSVATQWENAVRMMCKEFRDMGVYIKIPGWYYVNGSNKCGIGYEEAAWSQPRHEQLLYGRQLMHNASYARSMSMSWSHIPFSQYHGGGGEAAFQPFKDHKEDYNWVLAQNLGNGVASDFRGPNLYDDETLDIMQKWVGFYQRYRGIINSDMVHISQAGYEADRKRNVKMDTLYHANSLNEGEKGLLWVYNQTDEERTEVITVPLYYTGLTNMDYPPVPLKNSLGKNVHRYGAYPPNYDWIPGSEPNYRMPDLTGTTGNAAFMREGVKTEVLSIDSNGNAQLSVTLPAMSFTFYTIYEPGEQPDVTLEVGQVKNVKETAVSDNTAELSWDEKVSFKLTEDGVVNENPPATVEYFNVYRDGTYIGRTMDNSIKDENLEENKEYTYTISAVASGVEGARSAPLTVTTLTDETKPSILGAVAKDDHTIAVTFSENVDPVTGANAANYTLSDGLQVKSAGVQGRVVTLTTDPLGALTTYTLTVQNVCDASENGNSIELSEQKVIYGYIAKFSFDESDAGRITDTLGNSDGKAYSITAVPQTFGALAKFQKDKSSYGDLGSSLLEGRTEYAISLWFNASGDQKQMLLSQGQENILENDLSLWLENGALHLRVSDKSGTSIKLDGGTAAAGVWHLATAVRDGDSFTLYLDGEKAAAGEQAGIQADDSKNALLLGAVKNHAGGARTDFFDGTMGETALYSIALQDSDIKMLFDSSPIALNALLNDAKAIDGDLYTPDSAEKLAEALAIFNQDIGGMTPADIIAAKALLEDAMENLTLREEYQTLRALYHMDEKDGEAVYNALPEYPAQFAGGQYMRIGTPFVRGAYLYENTKNYISIPVSPLAGQNDFTVSGWFKPQLWRDDDLTAAGKEVLLADADARLVLSLQNHKLVLEVSSGSETKTLTSSKEITFEAVTGGEQRQAWQHVSVVHKGEQCTLYLNGEEVAADTLAGVTPSGALTIGAQLIAGERKNQYNGLVDEFSFYSSALLAGRIGELAAAIPFRKSLETNLALNKTLASDSMTDQSRINDGKVLDFASPDTPWTARSSGTVGDKGLKYGFDLGRVYQINALSLTQFFRDYKNEELRRFRDVVIQISTTPDFSSDVTTVLNTDSGNRLGQGAGTDAMFYSFELGYDLVLDNPVRGRYVRLLNSGFYNQDGSYSGYVNVSELEVYGEVPPPAAPELSLSRDQVSLTVAGDREFVRIDTDVDTNAADITAVSGDESVAKVINKNGILQLTAFAKGTTAITLTHPRNPELTKTIQVTVNGLTPVEILDDTNSSIRYDGSVTSYNSGRGSDPDGVYEYGTGIHYSTAAGDYAEFTFTGTGFDIISTVNAGQGLMEITIDGKKAGSANLLAPTTLYPKRANQMCVYSKTDLAYGEHTVRVVNCASESGNHEVTFDAFRIYKELPDTDKKALTALIEKFDNEALYTPASWAVFAPALQDAKDVLAYEGSVQSDLDAAYTDLLEASLKLVERPNKSGLKALIDEAEALDTGNCRPGKVTNFEKALAAAWDAYNDPNADLTAVNAATDTLLEAMLNLKDIVDRTELNKLVAILEKLDETQYFQGGFDELKKAIAQAKLLDDDASVKQVEDAYKALQKAYGELVRLPDKTALANAVKNAETILKNRGDYMPSTIAGLEELVQKAKAVLNKPEATIDEVTAELNSLTQALAKVRVKEDRTALLNAIDKANKLEADKYTVESYAFVKDAAAKAVLTAENGDATKAEIEKALADLNGAMDNLVLLKDDNNGGSGSGGDETTDVPKTGASAPGGVLALTAVSLAALWIFRKKNHDEIV